jgi:hypothetical protein
VINLVSVGTGILPSRIQPAEGILIMNRKQRKKATVMTLGAWALGLGLLGSAYGQTGVQNRTQTPAYQSSIKVPDENENEQAEAAKLASLARIDATQANAAALAAVPGTVRETKLDNENGNLVYSVEIKLPGNEIRDVKVDAGDGKVLHVDADGEEQDDAGERDNSYLRNPLR